MRRFLKKSKKLLGRGRGSSESSEIRASESTPGNTARDPRSHQGSASNLSAQSAPTSGVAQASSDLGTASSQPQEAEGQSHHTQHNAFKMAGKKSLTILKELSDFIPVPALGGAIGVVSEVIDIYDVSKHS